MTVYEFAPARLSEHAQLTLKRTVLIVTTVAIAVGLTLSWPVGSQRWIQIALMVLSVMLTSAFSYRVSSIDKLFSFGLLASILATLATTERPVFLLFVWMLGTFIGHAVVHRSFFMAAESTLCMGISGAALITVWQATTRLAPPTSDSATFISGLFTSTLPPVFASLFAYYLVRCTLAIVRAKVYTSLSLREIVLRTSWIRVGIMLAAEFVVALCVIVFSAYLNKMVFQDSTPFGRTTLVILLAASAFGLASLRQARGARHSLNSLVDATVHLPWPSTQPVADQALAFARQALPEYEVRTVSSVPSTAKDHISSIPIEEDGKSVALFSERQRGQAPFRVEDQRTLTALARVANETIRGRKEVHKLREIANTDRLTGLLNYRAFQLKLNEIGEWHSPDNFVALVFIDVDNFKSINDTYGHEVGNAVLRTIAERIEACVPPNGLAARVGGDEFVVMVRGLRDKAEVEYTQSRMRDEVGVPIEIEGTLLSIRISQGVAFSVPGQKDLTPLVDLADRHMYLSRGSSIAQATPALFNSNEPDNAAGVILSLREGILQRRLRLVYQPIVEVQTQKVVAVEALVRYTDPVHGIIPTQLLLNEAQRFDLLSELSEHVLDLTSQAMLRIRNRFPELQRVHLNVMLEQLVDPEFTRLVDVATQNQPEMKLVLEINEHSLRHSTPEIVTSVIEFSKRTKAELAFDDIGQAYTGFTSLRDYPFLIWKMDQDVVQNYQHERTLPLVQGMLEVAAKIGACLIFEGVETAEQNDWLASIGAQYAQGYLYGMPVTEKELLDQLEGQAP